MATKFDKDRLLDIINDARQEGRYVLILTRDGNEDAYHPDNIDLEEFYLIATKTVGRDIKNPHFATIKYYEIANVGKIFPSEAKTRDLLKYG